MKIVFFGTPAFVVPVLESLINKYNVIAVVTAPDKKVGRKQIITPPPVKEFAVKDTIKVLQPEQLEIENLKLEIGNSDLFVVAAYGKIIPQEILDLPKYGAINIHPSELPKYRGPSPITQTILNGDKTSAISIMQMDEKMDHGPIIKSFPYDIPDDATAETLTPEMFRKSAALLPEVIDDYVAGKLKPEEQNHDEATYTHIIKKEDGYIDLYNPPSPEQLDRMIRAYYPWPTVWGALPVIATPQSGEAISSTKRIKLLPSYVCHSREGGNPEGTNYSSSEKFCIQMEGRKPMTIKDFLNGYPELKEKLNKLF